MHNPRFVVTSVVRRAEEEQSSGFIRVVDLETKRILARAPIPESTYRHLDHHLRQFGA